MSESNNDNKFKEELEKELENGLYNASDDHEDDDFTVRVRREDYIVKRRFYDKDKALETSESLRKDKLNLVDDTLEGQALSSDAEEDETVDWDKLVDAGLEFDPPIAHAAEKKPGEDPVGLAEQIQKTILDDKELEKTMVVKRPRVEPRFEEDAQPDEDVAFEDEDPESESVLASAPVHAAETRSKRGWIVFALIGLAVGAAVLFYMKNPTSDKPAIQGPVEVKQPVVVAKTPEKMPDQPVKENPPIAQRPKDETPAIQAGVVPVEPKTVAKEEKPAVPSQDGNVSAVLAKKDPVLVPPALSKPKTVLPEVMEHFSHTVHVSSYQDMTRANNAVSLLKKKGFDAFTGMVRISGKGDWYRVYVGYLKNLDDAITLAERIKESVHEDAIARKTPWAIQVGQTAPLPQLEGLVAGLKKKGYAVDTVPVSTNNEMVRILTGAFKNEAESAVMVSTLTKDGFSAHVVQR